MKDVKKWFTNLVLITTLVLAGTSGPAAATATQPTVSTETVVPFDEPEDLGVEIPATADPTASPPLFDPQQILVKFRSDATLPGANYDTNSLALDRVPALEGIAAIRPLLPATTGALDMQLGSSAKADIARIYKLTLAPDSDIQAAVEALRQEPDIEWAEPDYFAYAAATTPDDPLLADQWGLSRVQAPTAWDVVTGTELVVIAVLDSGLDLSHPDVTGKVWTNPGEVPGNGLDDDNNGYVDDSTGWDFVNDDQDPSDDNGHGTQVAGVAAADTNNNTGIAGVCWNCRIMPVKVMQASGVANYSDIVAGIYYAADKGAEVINISLGGYSNSSALQEAIQYALEKDAVVVAGAGNDNVSTPFYPASYPAVLAVAGTTITDTKATFSNYGPWVDVSAPAEVITSTFMGGGYGPVSGTSSATAFVSGLAGLLRSQHTDWNESLVRSQIIHVAESVDALNPAYVGQLGSGRLDAAAAVSQAPRPLMEFNSTVINGEANGRPTPGEDATLEVTLSNDWLDATGVVGRLSTSDPHVTLGQATADFEDIASGAVGTGDPIYTFTVASSAGYSHPIPFALEVTANEGAYSTTLPLTVTTRSPNEPVCGTIGEDTIWTNDKTYIVTCNVGLAPGYTLTIEAGTEVRFDGAYDFNVGGTLIADGTEGQPIRFASHTGSDWGRLRFDDTSPDAEVDNQYEYISGSILRHVTLEGTEQGIECNYATPFLDHLTVHDGALSCYPGSLIHNGSAMVDTMLLKQSAIDRAAVVHGDALVTESKFGNGLTVEGGQILNSTVEFGGLSVSRGLVQNNTVVGDLACGYETDIYTNTVKNGSIWCTAYRGPNVQHIAWNTIYGGGIHVGMLAEVHRNDIRNAVDWGILATGLVTTTENRIVDSSRGIKIDSGLVQGNLVANNAGVGLEIGASVTVISNTFSGNHGTSILISGNPMTSPSESLVVTIAGNNLEFNNNTYEIENLVDKSRLLMVPAQGNWWGTTDNIEIAQRIFDYNDDYDKGEVLYSPVVGGPVQTAPAYVRSVTLTPESPVGIEEVTFDVEFSREMAELPIPDLYFESVRQGEWATYTKDNSNLPFNYIFSMATDSKGHIWFGTWGGGGARFDGSEWTIYDTSNSGVPSNDISSIATKDGDRVWFGTWDRGVALYDGSTWTAYDTNNSGLPANHVTSIVTDEKGCTWFGTSGGGVAKFNETGWTVYNTMNSGLPHDSVSSMALDLDGHLWFSTSGGLAHFDGNNWSVYDTGNSEIPSNEVTSLAIDQEGQVWFGTSGTGAGCFDGTKWILYPIDNSDLPDNYVYSAAVDTEGNVWLGTFSGGVARFDGTDWTVYNSTNSGLPGSDVYSIAIDTVGSIWFGGMAGAAVFHHFPTYQVQQKAHWLSPAHYRASYTIDAQVPRDIYSVTVQSSRGNDGIEIAPTASYTFTVDYAGAIGDTTPPEAPTVIACGAETVDTLSAQWTADDSDGTITLYRYAIGTTIEGTDIVNWTETPETSFVRTNLNLHVGQIYYVTVQARNTGGIWSEPGMSQGVVAGVNTCSSVYLPLTLRDVAW